MAKDSYGVRASLESSFLDIEIPLGVDTWNSFTISLRTIFYAVVSFGGFMFVKNKSDMLSEASWWVQGVFGLVWVFWTWIFATRDKSGLLRVSHVVPVLRYLIPSNRKLKCRRGDGALPILEVIPFRPSNVSGDPHVFEVETLPSGATGNKRRLFGVGFRVVGNASSFLFQEDRDEVLNRVADFWKDFPVGVEVVQVTRKENQSTDMQVLSLRERMDGCQGSGVDEWLDAEMEMLMQVEGFSRVIHQYWFVLTSSLDSLNEAIGFISRHAHSSSWVFSFIEMLTCEELDDVIAPIVNGEKARLGAL